MSNPFYTATGNPATGAEGLSSLVRAEYLLIQTAFDHMPRVTTTGLFDTIFAQVGNFTYILPGAPGTLATTTNVATETTRATNAEAALAVGLAAETAARTAADALLAPKASPALTGVPTAPTAALGTNTTQVATTAFADAAVAPLANGDGFRNKVVNGGLGIWQSGLSFPLVAPVAAYTADQWVVGVIGTGGSGTATQVAVADAAVLNQGLGYALRVQITAPPSSHTATFIHIPVEDPRTFAGKSVRLTFWARADAARAVTGGLSILPGTGGSPAGAYNVTPIHAAVTTVWQRFSAVVALNAASTITPGTNGDGSMLVNLGLPTGVAMWVETTGVSLEIDTGAVTDFEVRDNGIEFAMAQRYFQVGTFQIFAPVTAGSGSIFFAKFPVVMRAPPTVTPTYLILTNVSSTAINSDGSLGFVVVANAAGIGQMNCFGTFTASARL